MADSETEPIEQQHDQPVAPVPAAKRGSALDPAGEPSVLDGAGRDDVVADELAAEAGLSYDTFRRRFTAQVGRPPAAYRTERRLQTAATLLRLTDMTHREIARTLGFADEFHLSRRFRATYGVAPRDYRRG